MVDYGHVQWSHSQRSTLYVKLSYYKLEWAHYFSSTEILAIQVANLYNKIIDWIAVK